MTGIGIDTGGTCTDAVLYDFETKQILACAKSATTHERLEIGISESLKKLPKDLVGQVGCISLSTTLATNACVENKGGRVCLIFVGVEEKTLLENGNKYGFDGTKDMRFLEGDPTKDIEPDWNALEEMIPEILDSYDSIAVSQVMARENNGAYEKEIRERILKHKKTTVICAYEIFKDLNVIKRGAGAFLNARLIPVIEEFFDAVHHVLEDADIKLPFMIMRSDGSLVSEQYARNYPVETLLCGPTASVKGASALMEGQQAVVVDMGGTTSDIALIKDGEPKTNPGGIRVGGWQTFVKGVEIDTFALGGDSQVLYHNQDLFLGDRRVLPISFLADGYPQVLDELGGLEEDRYCSARPLYEHLLYTKPVDGKESRYTRQELEICDALRDGPLGISQLAERMETDVYQLNTERLEREGTLLRSGFTPTDAMILKGDMAYVDHPEAAKQAAGFAAEFIARSTGLSREDIADEVYYLVKEKLFLNLVRILCQDAHETGRQKIDYKELENFSREAFAREMSADRLDFYRTVFSTDAVLLGVGAPTHIFLDDVAHALHTEGRTSDYSGVSNALGALLGDACAYETIRIRVRYEIIPEEKDQGNYMVYGDATEYFESMEEAIKRASEVAGERAEKKVRECGAEEITSLNVETKKKIYHTDLGVLLHGADVTACARGNLY